MVKKRVHELAKELGIESKELIKQLQKMGINIKSHMSTLEHDEIERVKNRRQTVEKAPATKQPVNTGSRTAPAKSGPGGTRGKSHQRFDQGPGLTDRVPSRPPDRRFTEKQGYVPGPATRAGAPKPRKAGLEPKAGQQSRPAMTGTNKPKEVPIPRHQSPGTGSKPEPKAAQVVRDRKGAPEKPVSKRKTDSGTRKPRFQKPATGGKPAPGARSQGGVKPMSGEKAKPDQVKAAEKTKAQERQKQMEKQAFKDKENKSHSTRGSYKDMRHERQGAKRGGRDVKGKSGRGQQKPIPVRVKKPIFIGETITVKSLAEKMAISASEVIKKLMELGVMATINQEVDADTATLVANELGFEVELKIAVDKETLLTQIADNESDTDLQPRPCVVTIMGHVDHGKTSLLDAIRRSNVTSSEAGGITQHIGAYQVEHKGKKITFVDTPGHEAFTAMRARGARVTDIAILVVAADDGVMPQTIEAINHSRAAEVPIIVAVNKIDKPQSDPERIKRQLTEHNLVAEEWGGDTIFVEVSAKERTNLDELLEMILLVAEIGEYKANPNQAARGTVIEAELDKGRGPVATVLVQNGTVRVGDFIIAGVAYGKVRAMQDHTGRRVKKAGPSTPVEILGFSEVPPAGELFYAVVDEKLGRQVIDERQVKKREEDLKVTARVSLDELFTQIQEGQVKELNIIIKADVQGSVEAVRQALQKMSTEEVRVNVIHGGVGAITETDIMLASASNAIVIGFNVRPDVNARKAVEVEKVDIRLYRVIYDAIEDIKAAMTGLLDPEYKEVVLGRAEVRKTFKASKLGTIAGCYVTEGKIARDAGLRVVRDGIVIHEGVLDSLKRFKDDAREVTQGYECGVTVEKFNDIREGDQLEAFVMEAVKRELT